MSSEPCDPARYCGSPQPGPEYVPDRSVQHLDERANQRDVVRWLRWRRVLFLGTLNGEVGHGPNAGKAIGQAKSVGLEKGAPDLLILEPRGGYHGLAVELKHPRGGVFADSQRLWQRALRERGYMAVCECGSVAAVAVIKKYLDGQLVRDCGGEDDDSSSDVVEPPAKVGRLWH